MQFGNYLSADDLSRIVQDARYAERLMQSPGLPFGYPTVQASPDTNFDCFILITDVESQGYYTGSIFLFNYAQNPGVWDPGSSFYGGLNNDIRVAVMNGADKLVVGWLYPCVVLGPGEQDNPYPDEPIAIVKWTVPLGCGLKYSPLNYVEVDLDSIAGYGLFVNTSGDCPKLDVNAAVLNSNVTVFDCGLEYDVVNTTLRVNLTGVVVPPFVWDPGTCSLDLAIACGLDVIGGSLVVDNVDLAGDNTLTSLVVGPEDCDLAVDFEVASEVNWRRDVITFFGRVAGGKVRLCYSIYVDTDEYNAAGLLLSHVVGDPSNVCREVDVCDPACCDDCTITYTSHVSPTTGSAPLAVVFTVDTLSGCTAPYDLFIDWGDGSSETHSGVSAGSTYGHTYSAAGSYNVDSVASDKCGFAAAATTVVVVTGGSGGGCDCTCCATGYRTDFTFTIAGYTGPGGSTDCNTDIGDPTACGAINRSWTLTHRAACTWDSGDSCVCSPSETTWALACNGVNWILRQPCVAGIEANLWKCPVASFNCNVGGVFTLDTHACCDGLPATITLAGSGAFIPCVA